MPPATFVLSPVMAMVHPQNPIPGTPITIKRSQQIYKIFIKYIKKEIFLTWKKKMKKKMKKLKDESDLKAL